MTDQCFYDRCQVMVKILIPILTHCMELIKTPMGSMTGLSFTRKPFEKLKDDGDIDEL